MRWLQSRWFPWLLLGLFTGAFAMYWALIGPLQDKEALKYTGCARDVLRGDTADVFGNYLGFSSYVLFLLPFVAIGKPMLAVFAQGALALAAARALSQLVSRISGQVGAGHLALVLVIACVPLQLWMMALYTESFFASLLVLFLERITRTGTYDPIALCLGFLLLFARPVGLLFVGPAIIWKVAESGIVRLPRWIRCGLYGGILLVAVSLPGIAPDQLRPIVEGDVICGFPDCPGTIDALNGSSILAAQRHLLANEPVTYVIGLFMRRAASLFTLVRPYYSLPHNVFLACYYVLFALGAFGWWRWRSHPILRLLTTVFILYTALIGLTHDEWSGRFLVPLWPLICAFAALGLMRFLPQDTARIDASTA